jgi:hypothetical protein
MNHVVRLTLLGLSLFATNAMAMEKAPTKSVLREKRRALVGPENAEEILKYRRREVNPTKISSLSLSTKSSRSRLLQQWKKCEDSKNKLAKNIQQLAKAQDKRIEKRNSLKTSAMLISSSSSSSSSHSSSGSSAPLISTALTTLPTYHLAPDSHENDFWDAIVQIPNTIQQAVQTGLDNLSNLFNALCELNVNQNHQKTVVVHKQEKNQNLNKQHLSENSVDEDTEPQKKRHRGEQQ